MQFHELIRTGNNMFKADKIIAGVVTGILFPCMFFVIFYELKELLIEKNLIPDEAFRLQFLCIISVVSNVIPAGAMVKNRKDQALKGIVGVTFLFVIGIIIYFNKSLLSNN